MLDINSTKKTTSENNTNETIDNKAPVISTYNQVKFDIYTLFQEFSKAYGSYKALERMNKSETKEAKHYEKLMTSYALQFHSLVAYGWNDTKKRMEQYDKLIFGEEQINKYGTIWNRFNRLCYLASDGGHLFNPEGLKYKPYVLVKPDFSTCNYAISSFLQFSGISAIENRFIENDGSEFGYGG